MSNTFRDKEGIIYTIKYETNNKKYNINVLGKIYEKYKSIFNKIEKDKSTKIKIEFVGFNHK